MLMPGLLLINSNWVIDHLAPNRNPGLEYVCSRTPAYIVSHVPSPTPGCTSSRNKKKNKNLPAEWIVEMTDKLQRQGLCNAQ